MAQILCRDFEDTLLWHLVFQMLSVERTGLFIEDMALPIALGDFKALMQAGREFEQAYIEQFCRRAQRHRSEPAEDFKHMIGMINRAFARIENLLGEEKADALAKWGLAEFAYPSQKSLRTDGWKAMFRRLSESEIENVLVKHQFSRKEISTLKQLMESYEEAGRIFEERLHYSEQEVSAWETELRQVWDRVVPGLQYIQPTVEGQLFKRFWKQLRVELGDQVMEELIQWARKEAESLGMPPFLFEQP
ncbi:MAG TPA: hypothetical protein IGS52_15020 [Oscillatoriaceae cyanobacterium M33_DOE_052]|nr:hypothetical protein [Oscillatoriaceae cyanobacterium M33_DOE_052]